LTKTIRRPAGHDDRSYQRPAWDSPDVREGDIVYIRTYAGPIVRLRVKEVRYTSIVGIVFPEDNEKTYLAGCEPCSGDQICVFPPTRRVTRKEFEEEDWRAWIVRRENKKKSSRG
jgi:hypothetical protein